MDAAFRLAVLACIRQIPPGQVSSYGVLAALAGYPRHARHVGKLLAAHEEDELPWYRVVAGSGRLARPGTPEADLQRALLQSEGIAFRANGSIDLRQFGWPVHSFMRK